MAQQLLLPSQVVAVAPAAPKFAQGPMVWDVVIRCACGGFGCGIAGFLTNPFDVVKIRNQQYGGAQFGGFLGSFKHIYLSEGAGAFLKGAKASVLREATYSSVRMGFYEPIKGLLSGMGLREGPAQKWASSFLSGAVGAAIFNPIDLVKVRLQTCLSAPGLPLPPHGSTVLGVLGEVYRSGGVLALWAGTSATVVRAALLTSAQLGTYDVIQNDLLVHRLGFQKSAHSTHLTACLVASVVTATASNPPDVVKTRVMNCTATPRRGPMCHAREVLRTCGLSGFFKGWTASYCRLGPHTIISLMMIEKAREWVGLESY